jgi:hypothetical protein
VLYPNATFGEYLSFQFPKPTEDDSQDMSKFKERGWNFISQRTIRETEHYPLFHINERRLVHDQHTWVIPLDTQDFETTRSLSNSSDTFAWDPSEYTSWKLSQVYRSYAINFHIIKPAATFYGYMEENILVLKELAEEFRKKFNEECSRTKSFEKDKRLQEWIWWAKQIYFLNFLNHANSIIILGLTPDIPKFYKRVVRGMASHITKFYKKNSFARSKYKVFRLSLAGVAQRHTLARKNYKVKNIIFTRALRFQQ